MIYHNYNYGNWATVVFFSEITIEPLSNDHQKMSCIQVGGEINYTVEFYMMAPEDCAEIDSPKINGINWFSLIDGDEY